MADSQSQWMKLSQPPFKSAAFNYRNISHILTLNEMEILVTFDLHCALQEIWIYNISNDIYTQFLKLDRTVNEIIKYYTASLNDNKSFLYLFGESGQIIKLNLKTKQFEISNKSYHDGSWSRSLFIDGQFHIFGG
eukprot:23424_1